jgi:hypothetical protein
MDANNSGDPTTAEMLTSTGVPEMLETQLAQETMTAVEKAATQKRL